VAGPMTRNGRQLARARAASGHATAAPPSSVMNSRRLMGRPFPWNTPYHTLSAVQQTRSADDRVGSDSVIRRCLINARITPASGPQRLITACRMSARTGLMQRMRSHSVSSCASPLRTRAA
jgi:hypothetical protein